MFAVADTKVHRTVVIVRSVLRVGFEGDRSEKLRARRTSSVPSRVDSPALRSPRALTQLPIIVFSSWYDMLEEVAEAMRRDGLDVNEALIRAIEVTNDWRYVPGAAAIRDRLSPRRDNFLRLRDICQVLNPQPAAQAVTGVGRTLANLYYVEDPLRQSDFELLPSTWIHNLLAWIDRVDLSSQSGATRPPFETERGEAIFPDTTWWITEAGGNKEPPPVLEFDDAQDDNEEDADDDKHEADDADDSSSDDEKADGNVAVGDLHLSQELQTQTALANHHPTLGWRPSRSTGGGNLPPAAIPAPLPVYVWYFERQIQSRCGMHALNNALGERLVTPAIMRAACDRYLAMYPTENRAENEKPSGWYSMNVMVLAVEIVSKSLAARHERHYGLRWEPLFRNPGVIHQCVGAVANLRQQHWIALKSVDGQIWRLDSLDTAPKSMTELDYSWFIRANRGTYPLYAIDKDDERMALAETCSTTAGMEDTLVESPACTLQTEATAGSSCCSNSLLAATQADSTTPPTTQPAASEQLPQDVQDPSPEKRGRVDGGPPCLAIAEQISPADAQQLIVDAFNRRAFELSLGVDSRGDAREGSAPPSTACGEVDVEMGDAMEVDEGPACLAVAEQISVEDACDMIIECFNQRASEMERDELEAKASFVAALVARGGN